MSARGTVAVVEDDADLRASLAQMLSLAGYAPRVFAAAEAALREIDERFPGPVVTDVRMPGISGIDLLHRLIARDADLPVILMTGHGDVDMAVAALKAGAWDFLPKPFDPEAMVAAIARGASHRALVIENRRLREADHAGPAASPLIGRSPAIVRLREMVDVLARADLDLLIEGETGTGKELFARLIHGGGNRRKGRFVVIACPALSDRLVEDELFSAHGAIAGAGGGTLFLDDIDRASPTLQSRLVEFAETRTLGARAAAVPVDCRIIASAAPADAAAPGAIVPALLYRLAGMRLHMPPLRERAEDVPLLFARFVAEAASRLRRPVPEIDGATRDVLVTGEWPGNVRQLASFADQFVLGLVDPAGVRADTTLPERVDAFERAAIVDAVLGANGEMARAIAALGLPRKTFYYKVARHGIDLTALRRRRA